MCRQSHYAYNHTLHTITVCIQSHYAYKKVMFQIKANVYYIPRNTVSQQQLASYQPSTQYIGVCTEIVNKSNLVNLYTTQRQLQGAELTPPQSVQIIVQFRWSLGLQYCQLPISKIQILIFFFCSSLQLLCSEFYHLANSETGLT